MINPIVEFAVGIPKGQPRPKAVRRGKHAGVYDPGTANDWKTAVKAAFSAHHGRSLACPLKVSIVFAIPRPKGHFGKSGLRKSAPARHTGKPDLDNAAKAVLDALTDCQVWKDDSYIFDLRVRKMWTEGTPGARISIHQLS